VAGSFRIRDIVDSQAGWFLHWNAVRQLPAFLVFLVAITAEVNRTPFDLPEAETELVAGFHTEYSSMRFALIQMAEYVNMITASAVGANLFFGGWHFGIPGVPDSPLWFVGKMLAFLFLFIWLRGTVPRFRYDQLMHFGWKVLVPIAMAWIFVCAAIVLVRQS
jgi:NADH-quinone oxidoreductase subunit H